MNVAASLSGLLWKLPCNSDNDAISCVTTPNTTVSTTLGGGDGLTYDVTTTAGDLHSGGAVAADGTIYVAAGSHLQAIGPDGVVKWTYDALPVIDIRTTPAVGKNGLIYFGSDTGRIRGLTPTGTEQWHVDTLLPIRSSPAIGADGTVYIGTGAGQLLALDGATGRTKWTGFTLAPIGADDGNVYAVNDQGTSGLLLWAYWTVLPVRSSPLVGSDGVVYVGSTSGKAYALRPGTNPSNRVLWSMDLGSSVEASPAIGASGTVYFGALGRKLYAFAQ